MRYPPLFMSLRAFSGDDDVSGDTVSADVLVRYVCTLIKVGVEIVLLPRLEFFFSLLLQPPRLVSVVPLLLLPLIGEDVSSCGRRGLRPVRSAVSVYLGFRFRIPSVVASKSELAHGGLASSVPMEIVAPVSSILDSIGNRRGGTGETVQDLCVYRCSSMFLRGSCL